MARREFVERAAGSLAAAASAAPQLSTAAALDRCRARMLERLDGLRREPRRQVICVLHQAGHSAYQG
jgi:hypothetical protein